MGKTAIHIPIAFGSDAFSISVTLGNDAYYYYFGLDLQTFSLIEEKTFEHDQKQAEQKPGSWSNPISVWNIWTESEHQEKLLQGVWALMKQRIAVTLVVNHTYVWHSKAKGNNVDLSQRNNVKVNGTI